MGRLLEKLNVKCRSCGNKHIPYRITGKYLNGGDKGKRIHMWQCRECRHIWVDSSDKNSNLGTGRT